MNLEPSYGPLAAVLISLLGTLPIMLSDRRPNLREAWTVLISLGKFTIIAALLPAVLEGGGYRFTLAEVLPGVAIALRVDAMGMYFALVASFLWILTSIYSIGYMRALDEHDQTRYYASFAVAMSATIGVAFSANMLTLYLFYEMLSLSTYPLVTHKQNTEARSAGRKYLTYLLGTSVAFVLPAMILIYSLTGTLDFAAGGILAGKTDASTVSLLLVLLVFGFAKAAVMPFHGWLPAAMVAPTPVSSFLHGVAVVKVGVFSILRMVFFVFGTGLLADLNLGVVLTTLASVTIIVASLVALTQDNLKRRLAYSTIGQLSYMILGAGMLTAAGMTGGLLHLSMHAFGKITLFLCAGAIYVAAQKSNISEMDGLGRRMPVTYAAFFLASLSIIGMPPMGGFLSKWSMVIGAIDGGQLILVAVVLVSSMLNAAYFFPIVYRGIFARSADGNDQGEVREAPLLCLIPLSITALFCLALFVWPTLFLDLIQRVVSP
jgi:multicomponent Na+:H+ antiporter subunit D